MKWIDVMLLVLIFCVAAGCTCALIKPARDYQAAVNANFKRDIDKMRDAKKEDWQECDKTFTEAINKHEGK